MTPHRLTLTIAIALALAASACSSPAPAVPADTAAPVTQAPAPAAPAAPAPPAAPTPGPVYDETLVNFGGYRTATFNSDAAAVRSAYDGTLAATPPPESPEACHYLLPQPMGPGGYLRGFMFEGGRFVRVDIDDPAVVAPGGITIGMTEADVRAAFADVEVQPHKYSDGKYLVVAPPDGGEARLVFETGADGRIEEWRIGLPPQVHYVEGCS